ncbi:MAG: 6,7-dimethyl-8-ribityllumazine synthase [Tepidisphaera sp.]|nr:6,7-dimethyl-8-ribityllumazine synthase [Tepidisphaera sp.]
MAKSSNVRPAGEIAIIVSRYNASVTGPMLDGAKREYARRRGSEAGLHVFEAPGAYELPVIAQAAAESERFDGVVALGCVIKGETSHDKYISQAVADGLMLVGIYTGVPAAFGVLTVDTPAQAMDRAGGAHGNKGEEAMAALLDTLATIGAINGGPKPALTLRPDKAGQR